MENKKQFDHYTQKILEGLPYWFSMKNQATDNVGARFLEVIGLALKDIKFLLDYGYQQTTVESCDNFALDVVYKALIPVHQDVNEIERIFLDEHLMIPVKTIKEFYGDFQIKLQTLDELNTCFIDETKNILYVKRSGNATIEHEYGVVRCILEGEVMKLPLEHHTVWNYLDEFGLLFQCERLKNESNFQYKKRLLDVFIHPGNSAKNGLLNAIGRELGTRHWLTWEDGTQPFVIPHRMLAIESLEIDGVPVPYDRLKMNVFYQVEIEPDNITKPREISYIEGVEMHQLYQYKTMDQKLKRELLTIENQATSLFKRYVRQIQSVSPIQWNHFKWDESYWDSAQSSVSGEGCVPSLYDASIEGFKKYKRQT